MGLMGHQRYCFDNYLSPVLIESAKERSPLPREVAFAQMVLGVSFVKD